MFNFRQPPQIISEWQYKPYALEPGHRYVFELVAAEFTNREQIEQFKGWLKDNGINAHLVFTRTGNGIKPLEVKTHRESEE